MPIGDYHAVYLYSRNVLFCNWFCTYWKFLRFKYFLPFIRPSLKERIMVYMSRCLSGPCRPNRLLQDLTTWYNWLQWYEVYFYYLIKQLLKVWSVNRPEHFPLSAWYSSRCSVASEWQKTVVLSCSKHLRKNIPVCFSADIKWNQI